jgi:catechol 2,3-dioxygenase-like lactoylglutathione lyase family enzyme
MLNSITPFFIVDDLAETLQFYEVKLGFEVRYKGGGDVPAEDYWAMVGRDQIMIMLKHVTLDVHPQPSSSRHEWVGWDAYIFTSDPDSLYAEFLLKNVPIHRPLSNTSDALRAFEVADNNGYVLCFGRPIEAELPPDA